MGVISYKGYYNTEVYDSLKTVLPSFANFEDRSKRTDNACLVYKPTVSRLANWPISRIPWSVMSQAIVCSSWMDDRVMARFTI